MARQRNIDITVGIFVAIGIVAIVFLALRVSNFDFNNRSDGYRLLATFTNVGSLKPRAPVRIAGVKIGQIESVTLDPKDYHAKVWMKLNGNIKIPDDTIASINTSGLLGEQYLGLEPGGSDINLKEGEEIAATQSAISLEQMISKFMFSSVGKTDSTEKDTDKQ